MNGLIKKTAALIVVSALCIICTSCASYHHNQQKQHSYELRSTALPPFGAISISGNANVMLSHSATSAISFAGSQATLDKISAKVANNTLSITSANATPINVYTNHFVTIIHSQDHAYLISNNLPTKNLMLLASGDSNITLNGLINLSKIVQSGTGKIEIKWLDSTAQTVVISTARGPIYLAGCTKNLIAKLSVSAHLDARYLRANNATIIATDRARADVTALKTLSAYADEHSHIFYYKRPQQFTKVGIDAGNILMTEELR